MDEQLDALFREALQCNRCFSGRGALQRSRIDIAQPRWIGKDYGKASPKVLILCINPGEGANRTDWESADGRLKMLIEGYRNRANGIHEVFEHQRRDLWNWGRFIAFYIEGFGLELDTIAMANIAWCGTRDNKYPKRMRNACFERHSARLLRIISPDLVVLSGAATHEFAAKVRAQVPQARLVCVLHFAHRKGLAAEANDITRVRAAVAAFQAPQGLPAPR